MVPDARGRDFYLMIDKGHYNWIEFRSLNVEMMNGK